MQAEGEVGGGEDGEGFDEDVGCWFVAREMWVELVSVLPKKMGGDVSERDLNRLLRLS